MYSNVMVCRTVFQDSLNGFITTVSVVSNTKGVAHTFDEAKQQACINAYDALKERCKKNASIVFIDAVHPT